MSAAERWEAVNFFIVDDLFGQDRDETLRFCTLLKGAVMKINRSFFITAQIRLDKANDPVLLKSMREAGIRVVAIGFESPIPEELKAMNKHLKPEEMIAMARVFHEHDFMIHGMFIFGYPLWIGAEMKMSAKDRLRHMSRFIRKAKIDTIQVLLPIPLPGTEMTRRLEKENRIFSKKQIGWEYYDGNFPLIIPDPPLTAEDLLASSMGLTGLFYRFKEMFAIGARCLSFPIIILWFYNLKAGWLIWYKGWRNSIVRFGGWLTLRNWKIEFKKSDFLEKLKLAAKDKS